MGNIKEFEEAIQGSIAKGSRFVALMYISEAKPYPNVIKLSKSGPSISAVAVDKLIAVSDWCFDTNFNHLNRRLRQGASVKVEILVLGVFNKNLVDDILEQLKRNAGVANSFQLPWIEETAKLLPFGALSFTMRIKIRDKRESKYSRTHLNDDDIGHISPNEAPPSDYSRRSDAESTITSIRMSEYLAGVNQVDEIRSYVATASEMNLNLLNK